MDANEALDILECMANLTDGELLSYLCNIADELVRQPGSELKR